MARTKTASLTTQQRDTFLTVPEITRHVVIQRIELTAPDGSHTIAPAVGWWVGDRYVVFTAGWKDVENHILAGWRA